MKSNFSSFFFSRSHTNLVEQFEHLFLEDVQPLVEPLLASSLYQLKREKTGLVVGRASMNEVVDLEEAFAEHSALRVLIGESAFEQSLDKLLDLARDKASGQRVQLGQRGVTSQVRLLLQDGVALVKESSLQSERVLVERAGRLVVDTGVLEHLAQVETHLV